MLQLTTRSTTALSSTRVGCLSDRHRFPHTRTTTYSQSYNLESLGYNATSSGGKRLCLAGSGLGLILLHTYCCLAAEDMTLNVNTRGVRVGQFEQST